MTLDWQTLEQKVLELQNKQKQGLSLSRSDIALLSLWHFRSSTTRQEQNYA